MARARVTTIDRRTNDHSGTRSLTAVVDGERYTRDVAANGTIEGPAAFISHLIESDAYAVEAIDEGEGDDSTGDSGEDEPDSTDDESAESDAGSDDTTTDEE